MSLYNDYLAYNGFTEAAFRQRAAAAGYQLTVYRLEPMVEIWLSGPSTSSPTFPLCFSAHESVALFFEVLEGTATHERIERSFLQRFPLLSSQVSEDIRTTWVSYLPRTAYAPPRRNALLCWYRGAGDWIIYQGRVLRCRSGTAAERMFALFPLEQERQFWILCRHGERLALMQTMYRLRGLDPLWLHDRAEHIALARLQLATQTAWLE
jgi:hypothetical protein